MKSMELPGFSADAAPEFIDAATAKAWRQRLCPETDPARVEAGLAEFYREAEDRAVRDVEVAA